MSINILERAVARLESLKAGATALPWFGDHNGDPNNCEEWFGAQILGQPRPLGNGDYQAFPNLGTVDDKPQDADLIVALSRTVDPMLSVLRQALTGMLLIDQADGAADDMIQAGLVLARAVLGERDGE